MSFSVIALIKQVIFIKVEATMQVLSKTLLLSTSISIAETHEDSSIDSWCYWFSRYLKWICVNCERPRGSIRNDHFDEKSALCGLNWKQLFSRIDLARQWNLNSKQKLCRIEHVTNFRKNHNINRNKIQINFSLL